MIDKDGLDRPDLREMHAFCMFIAVIAIDLILSCVLSRLPKTNIESVDVFVLLIIGELFFGLKHVIVWYIRLYQKYAPAYQRKACLFEPSCSQYAILSVSRFGAFLGTVMMVDRLIRCKAPNGGDDYPDRFRIGPWK